MSNVVAAWRSAPVSALYYQLASEGSAEIL
jgi:hypothetical protein